MFLGKESTLFRMDHDCHKSQITVIETETVRLKLILMKSDLLLCIYYYIYNIYIIYIINLVPVFFHFKLTVSVSTLFPVPLAEN
jgi:hypothetical protein